MTLETGAEVFRWWYTLPSQPDPQRLTVIRVNRKTVTVRTDEGSVFRIAPGDIAGSWSRFAEEN